MSKQITVHYDQKPIYNIYIEHDYAGLQDVLKGFALDHRKICIVSDSHVAPYYLEEVSSIASGCASRVISFVFEAGEQSKHLDTVGDLYEQLIREHFDRKDILLALGGGVVGDLAGYTAATYLRGIKVIQLPTSLLAMVDSSIGGKTGVDFRGYKNMIGAFHQPSAVYMNLSVLNTLTDAEYFSGYGEIIKHGLIKDMAYYQYLHSHYEEICRRDRDVLEEVVAGSCEIKRQVVENDPKEQGERALLNFGHTLGHAVEKLMNFGMLHGECVALGMVAATYLSARRGYITQEEYTRVVDTIRKLHLPVTVSGLDAQEVIEVSKSDKKMDAGQIRFILLKELGQAVITTDVTVEEMKEALEQILGGNK